MMNMKYLLAGFSCAALLALAPAPQVDAATVKDDGVDFSTQSMTVTPDEGESLVYVSFPKVKNDSYKEAKWTTYTTTGSAITVDLSSQNVTKDFYVEIKGNSDKTSKLYHFSPTEKVKADKVDNVNVAVKLIDKNKAQVKGAVEFATANGSWEDYTSAVDLSTYQENGATLRFRTKATGSEIKAADKKVDKVITKDKKDAIDTYDVVGNFASNEVKVKIGKRPAGPKIVVDYKKQQITIKSGNYELYKGTVAQGAKEVGSEPITPDLSESGSVVAWLNADEAKNKARSAYTEVSFDGVKALTNTQEVADMVGVTYAAITAKGDAADKKVTATVTEGTGKNAGKYDVEINNASGLTFEYAVSKEAPTATTKYTTVKAGTKKTVKKQDADAHVYVRLAADTKNKVWASQAIDMGALLGVPGTPQTETAGTGNTTPGGDTPVVEAPTAKIIDAETRKKITLEITEGATLTITAVSDSSTNNTLSDVTWNGTIIETTGGNIANGGTISFDVEKDGAKTSYVATWDNDAGTWSLDK